MLKIDLKNRRFDRLVVLKENGKKDGRPAWLCLCDCGKEKTIQGNHLRSGNTRSCGCLQKEKVKELVKLQVGENHPMFDKAGPNKGKKASNETKQKMSEKRRKENNPNWNPNLTDEERIQNREYPEYVEWRKAVYERDNFSCQLCGTIKSPFNAHHLEGFINNPELRTTPSNGVTLCKKCHTDFHHQYGKGSNTKQQFEEFIRRNKCLSIPQ